MLKEVFDLNNSTFIAYKNCGDETGISLPYSLNENGELELLFDVKDNTCLEFNTMLTDSFRNKGESISLNLSTLEIVNTETQETDEMMIFRSQIVSYNDFGDECKEKESESMLSPEDDMNDETITLNLNDREKIDAFNIDVWGNINGTPLNQNRKCILKVKLVDYKLNDNLNRLNSKQLKKVQK